VLVVVTPVDTEHVLEVTAADDQDPVEAVGAEGADPALSVGVRVRGVDGRADHPDALGPEDLIEGMAELSVPIVDQKPIRQLLVELHGQVACLLGDPAPVRI
jgi:hypothetical protein